MRLAIASGKGGTGKTTLTVALALAAARPVRLLDCDVEEPNAHLFFKTAPHEIEAVNLLVPHVDSAKCTACGQCAEICRFNAIATLKDRALIFKELCHGCGGCALVCPSAAISERPFKIGKLAELREGQVHLIKGELNVGLPLAPPIIRALLAKAEHQGLTILDCPPGTSCNMVAATRSADFVILITEPTPFGLHDLSLAVDTVRELGLDFGVVINRCDAGDSRVEDYCRREGIEVLLRIPDRRQVAEAYSRGIPLIEALPELGRALNELLNGIEARVVARRSAPCARS